MRKTHAVTWALPKSSSRSCRWVSGTLAVTRILTPSLLITRWGFPSTRLPAGRVRVGALGPSNCGKRRRHFPLKCLPNVEKTQTLAYVSSVGGSKPSSSWQNNPGFFTCSIKWDGLSTPSISRLIKSEVSGLGGPQTVALPSTQASLQQLFVFEVEEGFYMWKIYSGHQKEHTPGLLWSSLCQNKTIRLQRTAHMCELQRSHARKLGCIFMDILSSHPKSSTWLS